MYRIEGWALLKMMGPGAFFRSYIGSRRARNIGWRLDYFVISERLLEKVIECEIHSDITGSAHGSDHCPLSLIIDI
uniref:DNA-(apurinic or apyrimidinic site) endonuclease n=1 Tax=Meloidogyne incognita TaxID=6306 RepID=A0A914LFH4_MELIC